MPHFFFHLRAGGEWIRDEEGRACDPGAVPAQALREARELIAGDVKAGATIHLGSFIAVEDEAGGEVHRLHFRDAIRLA